MLRSSLQGALQRPQRSLEGSFESFVALRGLGDAGKGWTSLFACWPRAKRISEATANFGRSLITFRAASYPASGSGAIRVGAEALLRSSSPGGGTGASMVQTTPAGS